MDADLIPGLPADVARDCLARVPHTHFHTLRLTSPLWKQELTSHYFHSLRKSQSLTRHVIALVHSDPAAKGPTTAYRLTLFDPSDSTWHPLPPLPDHPLGLPLFCRIAPIDRGLALIGGWNPLTWSPTDVVFLFDFPSATWRRGARMPRPRRSFFGCAGGSDSGSGRVVVVAGGHDERKDALRSAMAYHVDADEWAPLPDMGTERDECAVTFLRGRFHVIGGYRTEAQGRFEKSGEAFDFDRREWGPVDEGFLETATSPRTYAAGAKGDMYMCADMHLSVREEEGKGWRKVAELPEELRAALQVVEWEGRVMVMGAGMQGGAQVFYFLEEAEEKNKLTWRKVDMPLEYSGHILAACCLEI